MRKLFPLILLAVLVMPGCKKYDDGPRMSLKGKKGRISRDWVVEEYIASNQISIPVETDSGAVVLRFFKSGTMENDSSGSILNMGAWSFSDKKEQVMLDWEGDDSTRTWTILRLTSKQFWVTDHVNQEVRYKVKKD